LTAHASALPPARTEAEARQIEQQFDGWHVWRSAGGHWWATRTGPGARYSRDDPRPMTVDGDDPEALRAALAGAGQVHGVALRACR
jgi:hypothetical protein